MSLTLRISRQTGHFVKTLPLKQYKQVVGAIFSLLNNPKPHDSQILRGSRQDNRRVDMGEYRIVYRVEGEELLILVAGKRNDDDIYKRLKRLE